MNGIKIGNIVKFRKVVDAGDENAPASLYSDDYGTDSAKCHVRQLATGLPLKPAVCVSETGFGGSGVRK